MQGHRLLGHHRTQPLDRGLELLDPQVTGLRHAAGLRGGERIEYACFAVLHTVTTVDRSTSYVVAASDRVD